MPVSSYEGITRIISFRGRKEVLVYIRDNEKRITIPSKYQNTIAAATPYTVYESEYDGLASSQTMVIPRGENVLFMWKNTTDAAEIFP